jgi:serine/threonine protein kinase
MSHQAVENDPIVGTTLGSFKISRVIGRGGMGTVYLGEHAIIGSRVAIKVLQERLASDEGLVARFYAEARAVNLIGHENIVNIFDMNVVPPHRYYLVMEFLEGKPLNHLMTQPVPAAVSIPILTQVCDALQAAHEAGVVHRDLKPENIFLIRRGKLENFVKVLDFGLAKLLDTTRSNTLTAAGLIVGTPEFMSPEQAGRRSQRHLLVGLHRVVARHGPPALSPTGSGRPAGRAPQSEPEGRARSGPLRAARVGARHREGDAERPAPSLSERRRVRRGPR